ncbi:MAG: hypothetical protein GXX91_02870, partial [Verrucomicrobiaceae bacterium]|nr:hypothetical protein [Verrucomicrobiaceae bacterium]
FGELPDEVDALLESLLAQRADFRETAASIREAFQLTGEVVQQRPALFRADASAPEPVSVRSWRGLRFFSGGAKIAAALAVLALAAGLGYRSGHDSRGETGATAPSRSASGVAAGNPSAPSPWARYQVDAEGRLAVLSKNAPRS